MKNAVHSAILLAIAFAWSTLAGPIRPQDDAPDPGTTVLGTPMATIDASLDSGRPTIELMVNGKGPFRFVVDTGASLSVIDRGVASELGLEVVGTQTLTSPGASEEIRGTRVQAEVLEAGDLRIESPVLATMNLVEHSSGIIEGVLGRAHFRDLLLTFDYPGSKIAITEGHLDPDDPAVIGIDTQGGDIRFPVEVSGVTVPMVLDTGAPSGFTLPKALESSFRFRSPLRRGPSIRLVGGVHQTWLGQLEGTVQFGNARYEDPPIQLTTYASDFGNIGFEILQQLKVTVDQANSLIRFERDATVRPANAQGPRLIRRAGPVPATGGSEKPRVGVAFETTPSGFVRKQGGLVVSFVEEGGAADEAGLNEGDIILTIGGSPVADVETSAALAELFRAPRPLRIDLLRGDERLTIELH